VVNGLVLTGRLDGIDGIVGGYDIGWEDVRGGIACGSKVCVGDGKFENSRVDESGLI